MPRCVKILLILTCFQPINSVKYDPTYPNSAMAVDMAVPPTYPNSAMAVSEASNLITERIAQINRYIEAINTDNPEPSPDPLLGSDDGGGVFKLITRLLIGIQNAYKIYMVPVLRLLCNKDGRRQLIRHLCQLLRLLRRCWSHRLPYLWALFLEDHSV